MASKDEEGSWKKLYSEFTDLVEGKLDHAVFAHEGVPQASDGQKAAHIGRPARCEEVGKIDAV